MIEHRKGACHANADALSRLKKRKCRRKDCRDCLPVIAKLEETVEPQWDKEKVRDAQVQDPVIGELLQKKEKNEEKPRRPYLTGQPREYRILVSYWRQLCIVDGILCRRRLQKGKRAARMQVIVPTDLRKELLELYHDSPTAVHLGKFRCLELLTRHHWWPGVKKDMDRWIKTCDICTKVKRHPGPGKRPLQQEMTGVRFGRIALDILSGLSTTPKGNTCILVVQDYYTKFAQAYSLAEHSALTCADALLQWIHLFGTPLILHTDQGREFESNVWQQLCQKFNIKKTRTNSYRPQSDGMVERLNRTLLSALSTMVNQERDNWDECLPFVVQAYNSTPHATTGCTPNLLVFGEELIMPPDLVMGVPNIPVLDPCPVRYVEELRENYREAYELVKKHTQKAANWQKRNYDVGLVSHELKEGDQVLRYYLPSANIKLAPDWDGPYVIDRKIADHTVVLRDKEGREITSHIDKLKPWTGREGVTNPYRNDPTDRDLRQNPKRPRYLDELITY